MADWNYISSNKKQWSKQCLFKDFTFDGIVIEVNVQLEKHPSSISVNNGGIKNSLNEEQLLKAYLPIFITEEGKSIFF